MASTRVATAAYDKGTILKGLRDHEAIVLTMVKTWEDKVQEWKETAPTRFAELVAQWKPGDGDYDLRQLATPPTRSRACDDYRVQGINHCIARVDAMAGDVIKLRTDDTVFSYIGDACG
jgi:hypothetical protein